MIPCFMLKVRRKLFSQRLRWLRQWQFILLRISHYLKLALGYTGICYWMFWFFVHEVSNSEINVVLEFYLVSAFPFPEWICEHIATRGEALSPDWLTQLNPGNVLHFLTSISMSDEKNWCYPDITKIWKPQFCTSFVW